MDTWQWIHNSHRTHTRQPQHWPWPRQQQSPSRLEKLLVIRGVRCVDTVVGRFSLHCFGAERVETVVGQASDRVIIFTCDPSCIIVHTAHDLTQWQSHSVTISFMTWCRHLHRTLNKCAFFLLEKWAFQWIEHHIFWHAYFNGIRFPKCLIRWSENCVKIIGFKHFSHRQYLFFVSVD